MGGTRDEVVESLKKQCVKLNFGFGSLFLKQQGTIEFKSSGNDFTMAATIDCDKIPYSSEFDAETNAKQSATLSQVKPKDSLTK